MKEKILFSVIIPVFKVEKYIEKCVKSVSKQSFPNFEIILIDDESPDTCPQICDKLKAIDARIKVIHKKNGGVGAARKQGAELAQGEYIVCVDGDDWIKENCLERIAEVIYETKADIVCYGMIRGNKKGYTKYELPYREGYYSYEDIKKNIFPMLIQKCNASYFAPAVWGKAIKRNIFVNNVLADKRAIVGQDAACIIACIFNARSMYVMKECFYGYRYNDESITKGKKVFNWDCEKVKAVHISSKINIHYGDFKEQLDRQIVHGVFNVAVSRFNQKKKYSEVCKEIKKHLKEPFYANAIENAHFSGSLRAKLMLWALKYRCIFPIWLYAKLK